MVAEVASKKSMEISKGNPDFDSSESNTAPLEDRHSTPLAPRGSMINEDDVVVTTTTTPAREERERVS
jgi:hypothetical protein